MRGLKTDSRGGQMNQPACHPDDYELLALREMVNPVLPVSHASMIYYSQNEI